MSRRVGCALVAAILLFLTLCGFAASRPRGDIPVPLLAGRTLDHAEAMLGMLGLELGDVDYDADAPRPHGIVIAQDPPVGWQAGFGAKVDIILAGPELARVPGVLRAPEDEARRALESAGVRRGAVTRVYDDFVTAGCVISQDPRGGIRIPKDTKVKLVVSLGPDSARMPGVVGRFEEEAARWLFSLGLKVRVEETFDPRTPGIVVNQSPPFGTDVPLGGKVTLTVSRGPRMARVPDVIGMSAEEAAATIDAAGFRARRVAASVPSPRDAEVGTVYEQQPGARAKLAEGAVVTYTVRLGP